MKCSKCGFENRPGARFCKQCGQPLQVQVAPPAPPTPVGTICLACGATAKPGARFCPRCGKPLAAEPTPPIPPPPPPPAQISTQPSMPPFPQTHAQPPSTPERRSPRWPLWVGGIIAFLCVAAIVVAAVSIVPKYIRGGEESTALPRPSESPTEAPPTTSPPTEAPSAESPAETPPPVAFDAQVAITPSATELRVGELLTVTVTITNTGQVAFGNLRYQLVGEWKPYLELAAGSEETVRHEENVAPQETNVATFALRTTQGGKATLQAYVLMDARTDPPSTESRLSETLVVLVIP